MVEQHKEEQERAVHTTHVQFRSTNSKIIIIIIIKIIITLTL